MDSLHTGLEIFLLSVFSLVSVCARPFANWCELTVACSPGEPEDWGHGRRVRCLWNTHGFAARLPTQRLMGCSHGRMASGQLVLNKLISACKRLCILKLLNPFQVAVAAAQTAVLSSLVFLLSPGLSIIIRFLISFWYQTLTISQMHLSILSSGFRYFFGLHPSSLDSSIPLSLCGCSLAEHEHLERVETYFCFTPVVTSLAYFSPLLNISLSLCKISNLRLCKREKCKLTPEKVVGFFCWIHVIYGTVDWRKQQVSE